jgi:Gluconate 2-dehydrogenase subunit 3
VRRDQEISLDHWIRDPETGRRIEPMQQPGYYPGYRTLGQKAWWDATTRETIEKRVNEVPPIRFFTREELPAITAICNRVIPQDDRLPEFRIPVVHYVDERLFENKIDGFRYEGMPPDGDVYRLGIRAMEETARAIHDTSFSALDPLRQDFLLKSVHDGKKLAAHAIWEKMDIHHFWAMLVGDCTKAYYGHPWAWDEIGYGGPAYPRAYMRLEGGLPEPWEKDEQRYEWVAPANSISDLYEPHVLAGRASHHGQGGTH